MEVLKELTTWEAIWRLFLLVVIIGLAMGLGMSLASWVIPFKTKKEITYDNLDKR